MARLNRTAPRAGLVAGAISLLLLVFPASVAAGSATVTQTANTDCAAGTVEFAFDASWDQVDGFIFAEALWKPDGSGGYADYIGWPIDSTSTTFSMTWTLTGQTVAGGETVLFTVTDYATSPVTLLASATGTVTCGGSQAMPTSASQCKGSGWMAWADFRNQGDCVSFVASKGKNAPAMSTRSSR